MLKKLLCAALACVSAMAFAAVDVNKADQAQLEAVKGIGTKMSAKILDERQKGSFKDWNDLISRVPGVGSGSATRLSKEGLTVNGTSYNTADASAKTADAKPEKK